jgi:predicted  nucleic acid-binding Zn-ribbon protein
MAQGPKNQKFTILTTEQTMVPNFVRTLRERGVPSEPPAENPFDTARTQWDDLREYATKVMSVAVEVDEQNKALAAEIEALRRENDRLYQQVDRISREQRATSAFAESLRARLKSMEQQISAALQESLQEAHQAMRQPVKNQEPARIAHNTEDDGARQITAAIAKINPRDGNGIAPVDWEGKIQ